MQVPHLTLRDIAWALEAAIHSEHISPINLGQMDPVSMGRYGFGGVGPVNQIVEQGYKNSQSRSPVLGPVGDLLVVDSGTNRKVGVRGQKAEDHGPD
eukprot:CAMPEP_0184302948 /NCGR_PEP_ID=MMETSP1049-20130417/12793_1 /TAXON_ID=77928 /ORGANISM="Proteomonas sulcata, Strain CCMP704" /LENGTH=96 /DNA_ID=CAMNT_0026614353 /DNA_START=432 /DNA_END=722 /DNA_ORIENTATION=-